MLKNNQAHVFFLKKKKLSSKYILYILGLFTWVNIISVIAYIYIYIYRTHMRHPRSMVGKGFEWLDSDKVFVSFSPGWGGELVGIVVFVRTCSVLVAF